MNNVLSVFTKLFSVNIIPGGLVAYPYYWVIMMVSDNGGWPTSRNVVVRATVFLAVSWLIGCILEDIGSRFEHFWNNQDKGKDEEESEVIRVWKKYLLLPVNQVTNCGKYIEDITLRMKFELSTGIGLLLIAPAIFYMDGEMGWPGSAYLIAAIPIILARYLLFEAKSSHALLHDLRMQICESQENKE